MANFIPELQGEWVLNEELNYVDNTFSSGTYSGIYGYFTTDVKNPSYSLEEISNLALDKYSLILKHNYGQGVNCKTFYYSLWNDIMEVYGNSLTSPLCRVYIVFGEVETEIEYDKTSSDGILLRTLVITDTATAPDEFWAWLVDNATKKEEEKPTQLVHYYRNNKLISIEGKSCKLRHYSKIKPTEEVSYSGQWLLNEELTYVENTFNSGTYSGIYGYYYNDSESDFLLSEAAYLKLFSNYLVCRIRNTLGTSYNIENRYYTDSGIFSTLSLNGNYVWTISSENNITTHDKSSSSGILLRTLVVTDTATAPDEFWDWLTQNATKISDEIPSEVGGGGS